MRCGRRGFSLPGERAVMDKWTDSSTFGVFGCFPLLLLGDWITLQTIDA